MFSAIISCLSVVIAGVCFAKVDKKTEERRFEGFKRLYDEDGRPLNEWIPINYAG